MKEEYKMEWCIISGCLSFRDTHGFCRVRKDYFDIARKRGKAVLVRTPNGERVLFPKSMKGFLLHVLVSYKSSF